MHGRVSGRLYGFQGIISLLLAPSCAALLPLKRVDPALVAEAGRLYEWVKFGIEVNGEAPDPQVKDE